MSTHATTFTGYGFDACSAPSATALAATKQQLLRLDGVGSFLEPAMDRELTAMLAAFDGPDLAEGLAAHHQKREPRWPPRR